MDDNVFRETNTMILNQVGNPPPTSVLLSVIEAAGGSTPEVVDASVHEQSGATSWRVVGVAGAVAFEVSGHGRERWFGGQLEDDGSDDKVNAEVHPLRLLRSGKFSMEAVVAGRFDRRDSTITGQWTFTFSEKNYLKVVTRTEYGRRLADHLLAALHGR